MTRFTKYKMLFEAMKKFVTEDPVESEKLTRCIDCADYILRRMNEARLKKEQEALLRQIKSNLDIQIPNDAKVQNLKVRTHEIARIVFRIVVIFRIVWKFRMIA